MRAVGCGYARALRQQHHSDRRDVAAAAGAAPLSRLRQIAVVGPGEATARQEEVAYDVGARLARAGLLVVTGGLGGVMAAASRGAVEAGGRTLGLLPGTDPAAANPWVQVVVPTGLGEARNALVVRSAAALVAVGGGWGTLSRSRCGPAGRWSASGAGSRGRRTALPARSFPRAPPPTRWRRWPRSWRGTARGRRARVDAGRTAGPRVSPPWRARPRAVKRGRGPDPGATSGDPAVSRLTGGH